MTFVSYAVAIVAVIFGARYWFVSMELRETNGGLKRVNEILRNENEANAKKANALEYSNSLLTRRLVKLTPKHGKNGRFVRKTK